MFSLKISWGCIHYFYPLMGTKIKIWNDWAAEMAQQLRVHTSLAENLYAQPPETPPPRGPVPSSGLHGTTPHIHYKTKYWIFLNYRNWRNDSVARNTCCSFWGSKWFIIIYNSSSGDLMPSFDLCEHQAGTHVVHIYRCKQTFICIKKF